MMTDIKWIKLSVNMFNDEKIKLIRTVPEGDKIIVIWVQMLCLAGRTNDGGSIYMGQNIYYTDEMLATLCDQPLNVMRIALKTLEQFGMIEMDDDGLIEVVNWEKHQNVDGMEKIREQNRIRKEKQRIKQSQKRLENSHVTSRDRHATEEEEDKEEEEEKNKESNTPSKAELESDFDKLWNLYPNKKGKQTAFTAYKKAIKSGTTNRDVQEGIVAYKKLIKADGTDVQFISHGSTWFNQQRWEDDYTIQPKQISYKNAKNNTRSESLPEWIDNEETDEEVEDDVKVNMQQRLAEIRAGKGASK